MTTKLLSPRWPSLSMRPSDNDVGNIAAIQSLRYTFAQAIPEKETVYLLGKATIHWLYYHLNITSNRRGASVCCSMRPNTPWWHGSKHRQWSLGANERKTVRKTMVRLNGKGLLICLPFWLVDDSWTRKAWHTGRTNGLSNEKMTTKRWTQWVQRQNSSSRPAKRAFLSTGKVSMKVRVHCPRTLLVGAGVLHGMDIAASCHFPASCRIIAMLFAWISARGCVSLSTMQLQLLHFFRIWLDSGGRQRSQHLFQRRSTSSAHSCYY